MFTVIRVRDCTPVLAGNNTPSPHARSQEVDFMLCVGVVWALEIVMGSGVVFGVVVTKVDGA